MVPDPQPPHNVLTTSSHDVTLSNDDNNEPLVHYSDDNYDPFIPQYDTNDDPLQLVNSLETQDYSMKAQDSTVETQDISTNGLQELHIQLSNDDILQSDDNLDDDPLTRDDQVLVPKT